MQRSETRDRIGRAPGFVRPLLPLVAFLLLLAPLVAGSAELTTATIVGNVRSQVSQKPVARARISAVSPSGRYSATTDARGQFVILGVVPDTYVVSVEAEGYDPVAKTNIAALPGRSERIEFALAAELRTIGSVRSSSRAFPVGATSDTFTVSGEAARAQEPVVSASGLSTYLEGTVQGTVAGVPGIDLDSFGNVIPRGGQVDDTIFDFDAVPIPQGLIAEPGGNVTGAQLSTAGIGATSVTLAGYTSQGDNALGGVVDEIPQVGVYPWRGSLELTDGIGALDQGFRVRLQSASPDLRWRYAIAATVGSQYVTYGNGTFLPSEAGTFGIGLQTRGESTYTGNIHFAATPRDDVSIVGLYGLGAYQQYGSPYAGETLGAFNGSQTIYPGSQTDPNGLVGYASGLTATYDVLKAQWTHSAAESLSRVQLYQSQFSSDAGGPYWDDNGLLAGQNIISMVQHQTGRETGLGLDIDNLATPHNDLRYGAEYRVNTSNLNQLVPSNDELIASQPTINSYTAYLADTWSVTPRLDATGAARLLGARNAPSAGASYAVGALDPHVAASYRFGHELALRGTFDHNTVAPKPLEVDRTDVAGGSASQTNTHVAPETGDNFTLSLEGGGKTQFRATYFYETEKNRIGVVPSNFQEVVANGADPGPIGVAVNLGVLRAHGAELWMRSGGLTLNANFIRAFSSTANQFALNGLNPAAVAAGIVFPQGSVPDLSATLSYDAQIGRRARITPSLSYESGYPYGNGTGLYIIDPTTKKPTLVPNDNYWNPGYNYYFLKNPSDPFNAQTNPYIGTLGTPESTFQNSLRTAPQMLANLHLEFDLSNRATVALDLANAFGNATPTQALGNLYLVGPPGYKGGNAAYEAAYANALSAANGGNLALTPAQCQPSNAIQNGCYTLGNGIPTQNGQTRGLPWSYSTAGYIGEGYPNARILEVVLRYRL